VGRESKRDARRRLGGYRFICGLAWLAFGLVGAGAACHGGGGDRPRNVILISIDTLRADHLGCYGHPLPTSPNLDAFAAEGTLFEDAIATSPWTLPSQLSLLTGLYPTRHGVRTTDRTLADTIPTLATLLARQGFETAAVVNSVIMRPQFGTSQGFAHYEMVDSDQSRRGAASRITDKAMRWLDDHRSRRVLLFLHYYDVHSNYFSLKRYERIFAPLKSRFDGSTTQLMQVKRGNLRMRQSEATHLARLYDAGIRQLDDDLARLFAHLRDNGWFDDTVVVVTSDHGEEFLEHGSVLHGQTHYQEMLRIPLIMRGPTIPVGARIRAPVSLVDVVPTLLGLLRFPPNPALDGVDLRALWRTPEHPPAERWLFAAGGPGRTADSIRSVRNGRYKLVFHHGSQRRELYDLADDPQEKENLVRSLPRIVERLSAELARFVASEHEAPKGQEIPPEVRERLEQLGYH
jgi:arylsulfatase A-like enzyme